MGEFSDSHNQQLYARAPLANGTDPTSLGDPTYDDPFAFDCHYEWGGGRAPMQAGHTSTRVGRISTYTALTEAHLIFPPGDDGSDLSTGRHPSRIAKAPGDAIDLPGEVLYLVDV